jgi:tetratricopeptide (TPR) repeat protein
MTEVVLQQLVEQNLSLFLYENAKFYAERLYYERNTQANLHTLAQCYFRQGKAKQAYLILQEDNMSAENRYLLAQCCLSLDKLEEGERALTSNLDGRNVPGGAAGLYLLGLICRRGHRRETAIKYFKMSIEVDSTNWGAIMQLSDMGEAVDITRVFGLSVPEAIEVLQHDHDKGISSRDNNNVAFGGVKSEQQGQGQEHEQERERERGGGMGKLFASAGRADASNLHDADTSMVAAGAGAGVVGAAGGNDENVSNHNHNHNHNQSTASSEFHLDRTVLDSSYQHHGGAAAVDQSTASSRMGAHFSRIMGVTGEERTTIQDRGLAESASGIAFNSPNVSMSLGMSSSSLNIPFASPGSVPRNDFLSYLRSTSRIVPSSSSAARASADSRSGLRETMMHSTTSSGGMHGSSALSGHSGPGAGQSEHGMSAVRGGGDSTMYSDFGGNSTANNHTRALFEMNSPVTPIGVESSNLHGGGLHTGLTSIDETGLGFGRSGRLNLHDSSDSSDHHANRNINMASRTPGSSSGVMPSSAAIAGMMMGGGTTGSNNSSSSSSTGRDGRGRGGGRGDSMGGNANVARRVSFGGGPEGDFSATSPSGIASFTTAHEDSDRSIATGTGTAIADDNNINNSSSPDDLHLQPSAKAARSTSSADDTTFSRIGHGISPLAGSENKQHQHQDQAAAAVEYGDDDHHDTDTHVETGPRYLAALLTTMAASYQLAGLYRCRECVRLLHRLPLAHFQSAWVQHLLGRAYCECNDYKPSLLALKEMLRLEPFRLNGTELLSTVLWHLKRDKDLCALAQQVADVDNLSPECWCVVGNCFSLQREPDAAIRFFKRAIQVDPNFTYAYTLSGHEAAHNEDFDIATSFFRKALLCDDRHYGAWYVVCYTIVLLSFLVCDVSVSLLSIYCFLSAFYATT